MLLKLRYTMLYKCEGWDDVIADIFYALITIQVNNVGQIWMLISTQISTRF